MTVIDITTENFVGTLESNALIYIEFFSPTCPHCRRFTPVFRKIAENFPDIAFGLVNSVENPDLSKACKIRGLPTVVVFRSGKEVDRRLGEMTEAQFADMVGSVTEAE